MLKAASQLDSIQLLLKLKKSVQEWDLMTVVLDLGLKWISTTDKNVCMSGLSRSPRKSSRWGGK